MFPKPHRYESKAYLEFVRSMACCVCMEQETDAHHVKTVGAGGSDLGVIPLCRLHHQEWHKNRPH